MSRKPLKTELHHWWPRSLAEYWSAADGMVSAIRPDGAVLRSRPGAFGGITNAHHLKMGGPWDSTFEPIFNQPDNEITDFVLWLASVDASLAGVDSPMVDRIASEPLLEERHAQIARITASLLARSPSIRNSIKITAEHFRREMGMTDPDADKTLIAFNQRGLYEAYRRSLEGSGRWAILFSDEREFIAGDGFFHNFPASKDTLGAGRKLVLPILPTAMIVYMSPMQYPTEPKLVTLRLSADEVTRLNEIAQVYAGGFLFFRDEMPVLTESFTCGRHQQFQYHRHNWLDPLLDDLSQYNRWGKEGAASICSYRPFSDPRGGNRLRLLT